MIVYVHSAEIYDRRMTFSRHSNVSDVAHIVIPRATSVRDIVITIIARVRNHRSIWLLVLNGHGNRSFVGIGAGIGHAGVAEFSALAPYMSPAGRGVEVHSCLSASRTNNTQATGEGFGVEFLRRMAHFVGRPVRGGYGLQSGQAQFLGLQYGDTVGRYESPWVTVFPNGTVVEPDTAEAPWHGPS